MDELSDFCAEASAAERSLTLREASDGTPSEGGRQNGAQASVPAANAVAVSSAASPPPQAEAGSTPLQPAPPPLMPLVPFARALPVAPDTAATPSPAAAVVPASPPPPPLVTRPPTFRLPPDDEREPPVQAPPPPQKPAPRDPGASPSGARDPQLHPQLQRAASISTDGLRVSGAALRSRPPQALGEGDADAADGGASRAPTIPATVTIAVTAAAPDVQPAQPLAALRPLAPVGGVAAPKPPHDVAAGATLPELLRAIEGDGARDAPGDALVYMFEWAAARLQQRGGSAARAALAGVAASAAPSTPAALHGGNGASPAMLGSWSAPAIGVGAGSGGRPTTVGSQRSSNGGAASGAASGATPGGAAAGSAAGNRDGGASSVGVGASGTGGAGAAAFMSLNLERPQSTGNTLRRLTCVLLGAERSNKEQLLAMIDTIAPSEEFNFGPRMSPALRDLVGAVRDRARAAGVDNVALVGCEADRLGGCVVFADVPSHELTRNLIQLTSVADFVCLVVSGRHGVPDMALRRQGELYSRVLLAHSVGIKRAIVVITDLRGVAPQAVENCEREVRLMFQRCGFDAGQLQIVRGTNSPELLYDAIARTPVQARIRYATELTRRFKATMIVLYGSGIKSGDRLSVFSLGHFDVRVESIPTLIDRRTNQVTDTDLAVLKLNQVASLALRVEGGAPARTAVSAPILVHHGGRVVAMGNVVEIDPWIAPTPATAVAAGGDNDDDGNEDEEGDAFVVEVAPPTATPARAPAARATMARSASDPVLTDR